MSANNGNQRERDNYDEMLRNKLRLKRISVPVDIMGKLYFIAGAGTIIATVFSVLLSGDILSFLDGIVRLVTIFLGYMSCYKHNSMFIVYMYIAAFTGFVFNPMNLFTPVVLLPFAIITIYCNREYHRLEKCPGFPQFDQTFEEQKRERAIRESKGDIYAQSMKRLSKNSSENMVDLDYTAKTDDNISQSPKQQNQDMDDIRCDYFDQ